MPTPTYVPLANVTLTGTISTVNFTSINQSYRDLILVVSLFANSTPNITFNNDTSANYRFSGGATNGSGSQTGYQTTGTSFLPQYYESPDATNPTALTIQIMDYSTSYAYKPVLMTNGDGASGGGGMSFWAGSLKNNTNPISSIQLGNINFYANTTLALYGVN